MVRQTSPRTRNFSGVSTLLTQVSRSTLGSMGKHARARRPGEWRECETLPRNLVWSMRAALLIMAAGITLAILGVPNMHAPQAPVRLTALQEQYQAGRHAGSQYAPNASNGPGRYTTHHPAWIWCHNALIFGVLTANNGVAGEVPGMRNHNLPDNYYPHTPNSRAWMSSCIKSVDPKLWQYNFGYK